MKKSLLQKTKTSIALFLAILSSGIFAAFGNPTPAQATAVLEDSCVEQTLEVVSSTDTLVEGGGNAVETWQHGNWSADISGAAWIWSSENVSEDSALNGESVTFTDSFTVTGTIISATLEVGADNSYEFDINGDEVASDSEEVNFTTTDVIDVTSAVQEGSNTLSATVENFPQGGGNPETNPAGLVFKITIVTEICDDGNDDTSVTATKIVCDEESDLPNWGAGNVINEITEYTASDFIEANPTCHIAEWTFAWSLDGVGNPGDQTTGTPEGWNDFYGTTTIPAGQRIWFRENINENYIPFTGANTDQSESAEIYCGTDVLNYDNWEYIDTVEGSHYYCVGFNVPTEPEPGSCSAEVNLLENASFEVPDVDSGTYEIVADINADISSMLGWLVSWTSPEEGGRLGLEIQDHVAGNPASGAGEQFAELDGDHPVTISQEIDTVIGETYTLTFKYSPRQGRNAADNQIEVRADGIVLGAVLAVDGSANSNTVWQDYTRTFVATESSTTIEFADTGSDTSFGGYIDDVRLVCGDTQEEEEITPPQDQGTDGAGNTRSVRTGSGSSGSVLGATDATLVEDEACGIYLNEYIIPGKENNPEEVKKLQSFLNGRLNLTLEVSGIYDTATIEAVKTFQLAEQEYILKPWNIQTPTGYVYLTTVVRINNIMCEDLKLPIPQILTPYSRN